MIAKHVNPPSGASNFGRLTRYITDTQKQTQTQAELITLTNCQAETVQVATDEILATQHMNTRASGDKTYHLLISFPPGENPTPADLKSIEERTCAALGYAEHQRISAVHNDTDNLHVHIAINKIHPTRNTMHDPYQSYKTLGDFCVKIESEMNLQQTNHQPKLSIAEGRAIDMERHSGMESLVGWIKRECLEEIKAAQSWPELHQSLQKNGLELRERGNGFVIAAANGTHVKASTISRDLSKSRLEERFGPLESASERRSQTQTEAKREYQKKPLDSRVNTTELYAKYKAEQTAKSAAQKPIMDKLRQQKTKQIETVQGFGRVTRASIKLMKKSSEAKEKLYEVTQTAMTAKIQAINTEYQQARQKCYDGHKRVTWAAWLQKEATTGNTTAERALTALRDRETEKQKQTEAQTQTEAKREYQKKPLDSRVNTTELYAKYKAEQGIKAVAQRAVIDKIRQRKAKQTEAAKRSGRTRRSSIKFLAGGRLTKKILYAQASRAMAAKIQAINTESRQDIQKCYAANKRLAWADWLKNEALKGNAEALTAMRAREAQQSRKGNTIQGQGAHDTATPGHAPVVNDITKITKTGAIIFNIGKTSVRDTGDKLQITGDVNRADIQQVLKLEATRNGERITISGTNEFKAQVISAAIDSRLPITFTDPLLESKRQDLLKENTTNDRHNRSRTGIGNGRSESRASRATAITGQHRQQDVSRVGKNPPPQSQNRLRELSQLGMVRIASRIEKLLSRNVPGDMEQPGTKPDHALRRDVYRSGERVEPERLEAERKTTPEELATMKPRNHEQPSTEQKPIITNTEKAPPLNAERKTPEELATVNKYTPEELTAVNKYISERESKRQTGMDIPKHAHYTPGEGKLSFAGTRNVNGQPLALVKRGSSVMVLPTDPTTAHRLQKIAIGNSVSIAPNGSIKMSRGLRR